MAYNPIDPNGQATMANSAPVVVASDQSAVPVTSSGGTLSTVSTVQTVNSVVTLASVVTVATLQNLAQIAGVAPSFNGTDLNINIDKIGGYGTHGITDADGNPSAAIQVESFEVAFNGTTWDRIRSILTATNTLGTGIVASGTMGQYVPSLQSLVSGAFGVLQTDSNGRLFVNAPTATGTAVPPNAFYMGGIGGDGHLYGLNVDTSVNDGISNNLIVLKANAQSYTYNGATWDRVRSAITSNNTLGTGIQSAGVMGQWVPSLQSLVSGAFGVLQTDSVGRIFVQAPTATGTAIPANAWFLGIQGASNNLVGVLGATNMTDGNSGSQWVASGNGIYNGSTWDRMRGVGAASGATLSTGILASGGMGFYAAGVYASLPSLSYGAVSIDSQGRQYVNVFNMGPGSNIGNIGTVGSLTTLTTLSNIVQFGGAAPTYTGGSLNVDVTNTITSIATMPQLPAAAALADATANPTTTLIGAENEIFNGTTWDRIRSLSAIQNGLATTGLFGAAVVGQYFPTTYASLASGSYGVLQVDPQGRQYVQAPSATAATVPTNAFYSAGRAQTTEITAVADGQLVGNATDTVGKQLVMPYANKELFLSGLANTSTTNSTQVIAAQPGTFKIYVTGFSVANTGATNTLVTFQNGSGASLPIWTTIAPTGGGSNYQFLTPIATSAAIGLFFQAATSTANLYVAVNGYAGK